jgi:hypothetical protein
MKPIVDIISEVVTAMKPTLTYSSHTVTGPLTIIIVLSPASSTKSLFVYERVKVVSAGVTHYGKIIAISSNTQFTVLFDTAWTTAPSSISVVLNFHHGHPLEIINLFKQATQLESVKFEQFPAICLFQDIPEKHSTDSAEREANLNLVIITDTSNTYEAAQRYTYTIKPILIPLYELFMEKLKCNGDVQVEDEKYDYIERLYWGKSGLYGNVGNIFNDFIDAIEINNLKVKTLKDI